MMRKLLLAIALFALATGPGASQQLELLGVGAPKAYSSGATGHLLLVNGTDSLLLVDGTSLLCLVAGC